MWPSSSASGSPRGFRECWRWRHYDTLKCQEPLTQQHRGADKSLARWGRKQATATEDFQFRIIIIIIIIIIVVVVVVVVGIRPLGQSGQRPEFSQATGMALVRCILGKFLGVACLCFPPLFRCSHFSPSGASTSAMTWEIPAAEVGNVGQNVVRSFSRNDDFHAI